MSDHATLARRFGEVVDAVTDWDAPTPVPEWVARDVVHHLTTWMPEFLAAGGVTVPAGRREDPVGSWRAQASAIEDLLAERADESFTHPHVGTQSLGGTIAQFYVPDVLMHTWDLARSNGIDPGMDEATCEGMLAGMREAGEMIRASGQFGVEQPVSPDVPASDRLMAFVGRNPDWHRSSAA